MQVKELAAQQAKEIWELMEAHTGIYGHLTVPERATHFAVVAGANLLCGRNEIEDWITVLTNGIAPTKIETVEDLAEWVRDMVGIDKDAVGYSRDDIEDFIPAAKQMWRND